MAEYAESWLQLEAACDGRVTLTGDMFEMRKRTASLFAVLSPHYPATAALSITDGSDEGIKYRLYDPKGAARPLPIGIYTHGGGFVLGDMDTDDVLCRTVVQQAETILVSVDYRLAPEHSYPAQLKNTTKVLEWVSFSPFTVHPDHVPQEYQPIYSSYIELGNGAPVIGRAVMGSFFRCANMDACNSDGFNLWHIEDFHPFPRVYAAAASCDPLRDNGRILAAAMKEAGVAVREKQYHRVPHCFWFFNSLPQWQAFIEDVVTALQWIVGKSHAQGVGCGI